MQAQAAVFLFEKRSAFVLRQPAFCSRTAVRGLLRHLPPCNVPAHAFQNRPPETALKSEEPTVPLLAAPQRPIRGSGERLATRQ